jgi:hypothetical protein
MQYMLLIYADEAAWESATADEMTTHYRLHRQFGERVEELGGAVVLAAPLESTSTATTIRGDLVTDGPFVESREALGGFYIIEAPDLDQMLAMAKSCPVWSGGIEIRPIVDTSAG